MPTIRDFKRTLQSKLDKKEDITIPFRAVLCDSIGLTSGSGSVWANQNTRMVWYLPVGGGQPAQVRCVRLEPVLGLGVIIGYADGSVELEVLSDDPFLRNSNTTGDSYMTVTPADLQPGGRLQLWLYSKLFVPLAVYPGAGLSVSVVPGDYEGADGTRKSFSGQNNFSIAAHQPAGPNQHCLVGISLNTSNALVATAGTTVSTAVTAPEPSWPANSTRLAVVDLDETQTTINFAGDITDRRLYFPYPGSGAILKSFLDAKGDLITATAADTPAILTVGANNTRLIPDSTQATGLRWGRLDNFSASAAPTAGDDSGDGYEVGSVWIDTTNDNVYVCVDATATAAVWEQASGGAGGGWPFDDVITVGGPSADYQALQDAIDACSGGEQIEVGIDVTEDVTVDVAVEIYGATKDITVTGHFILTAAAKVRNLTLAQTATGADNICVDFQTNSALVEDCVIRATGAGTNNYAAYMFGSYTGNELRNCDVAASGATNKYAVYLAGVAGTPNTFTITGGKLNGTTDDIYLNKSDMTLNLRQGPILANNDLNAAFGTVTGDYIGGGDLHAAGDRVGASRRIIETGYTGTIHSNFRTGNAAGSGELAAYALAGSPFVSGTISYSVLSDFLHIVPGAGARVFMYRSVSIGNRLECKIAPSSVINAGLRVDDGTDDNYYEFRVEDLQDGTVRINLQVRAGGGAPVVANGAPIPFHTAMRISLEIFNAGGGQHNGRVRLWGVGPTSGSLLYNVSAVSWTPTRGGPIAEGIGTAVYDWIGMA